MARLNTKIEPRELAVVDLVKDLSDGVGLTFAMGVEGNGNANRGAINRSYLSISSNAFPTSPLVDMQRSRSFESSDSKMQIYL
jgi:hypothetical protein